MPEGRTDAPDDALSTRERRRRPALIVNTGDGKGKSTAAMGLALRGWAQGWSVGVFQFVKSGKWPTGERTALEALGALHERDGVGGEVQWRAFGAGWHWTRSQLSEDEKIAATREAWAEVAARLAAERHQLYVLDEFTYPIAWGWLDVDEVVRVLRERPGTQHVVITGRRAAPELVALATTVTEMGKVKHPFDEGQRGQAGIEW